MQTILVVEDDESVARSLLQGLGQEGYSTQRARNADAALRFCQTTKPDLILLDLGLPDRDGFELLPDLLRAVQGVPVIILTARQEVSDRVRGLEGGAVDYMLKPFAFPELLARIRLRVRVGGAVERTGWRLGTLDLDLLGREVRLGGAELLMPPREFELLLCLLRAEGKAVSREEIAREVWKSPRRMSSLDNLIDVHISRLRERLQGPGAPVLRTLRGVGYVLEAAS
jgi:DNA-binding response OmpR family regulator